MPNYCSNHATFTHSDPDKLAAILAAADNGLFNTFVPLNDGDDPREVWGCKWDAEDIACLRNNESVTLNFSTPWSPPIEFYLAMEELGYEVIAYYYEPGMAFCGMFTDSSDNEYPVERNTIPSEIDAIFDIEEQLEEWYVENLEDVERFVYEGQQSKETEEHFG
jgi:hypothetical protein